MLQSSGTDAPCIQLHTSAVPRHSHLQDIRHSLVLALARVRIVSYPHSGRTWLRVMLGDLGLKPRFTHGGSKWRAHNAPQDVCNENWMYRFNNVVFLMRDPLDTVVSHYFGATLKEKQFDASLSAFLRHPEFGIERIVRFHQGWYGDRAKFSSFRLFKYERMRADPQAGMAHLIDFLGARDVGRDEIAAVVDNCRFEVMKEREKSGELDRAFEGRFEYEPGQADDRMKTRRGVIGGYRDYLNEEDISFCNGIMAGCGYDYAAF